MHNNYLGHCLTTKNSVHMSPINKSQNTLVIYYSHMQCNLHVTEMLSSLATSKLTLTLIPGILAETHIEIIPIRSYTTNKSVTD